MRGDRVEMGIDAGRDVRTYEIVTTDIAVRAGEPHLLDVLAGGQRAILGPGPQRTGV
jgi:hypothetical protein